MYHIVHNYSRVSKEIIDAFSSMNSASLHEAMGKRGALSSDIKAVWPGSRMWGSALTVQCEPGDNLILHKAISMAKPGDVIVVTTGSYPEAGIWGEVMTVAAMAKGIAGLVTDGSVRDTMAIKEHGFPVFSKGVSIKGTTKLTPGKINNMIIIGGEIINPGDVIFGDNDGLVVVRQDEAKQVVEAAKKREDNEQLIMEKLKNGEITMDLLGFNEAFNRLNLKEE